MVTWPFVVNVAVGITLVPYVKYLTLLSGKEQTLFQGCEVVIRKNLDARLRGVAVKTVFVMETTQDRRCRNSTPCWNRATV